MFKTYLFSTIELLILIIFVAIMIEEMKQENKLSAYLQIPYFIWLLFALYLNVSIYVTQVLFYSNIELNVIDKHLIIDVVKKLSIILGKENVIVRYDPIFLSDEYNLNYHIQDFGKLCDILDECIKL